MADQGWCGSVAIAIVTYGGGMVWQNKVGVVLVWFCGHSHGNLWWRYGMADQGWCGSVAIAMVSYGGGMVWPTKVGVVLWP